MENSINGQDQLLINGERLWTSLMEMAQIGAIDDGRGCCRLSLSDEDREARELFARWAQEAGCELRVDTFGNMFAIRPGKISDSPAILVGSHLDTQPHGGRFDGVLGVLAGLEIVRTLQDRNIQTEHPIAVVNWTNEEGVRFKPGLTGSKGFISALTGGDNAVTGLDGANYFSELRRIGYAGTETAPAALSYHELHIEQGSVLEAAGLPVGVVSGIQGVRWYDIEIHGKDAHAGTTPMQTRHDSFIVACKLALALRKAALALSPDIRLTFGRVEVEPNSLNTIPGVTRLGTDVRHEDSTILDCLEKMLEDMVQSVDAKAGYAVSFRQTMDVSPVRFDPALLAALLTAAEDMKIGAIVLPSGAMHDASSVAMKVPSAMIFVQSRDGISHNPAEWSEPTHVALGCELLARAVLAQAKPFVT